MRCRATDLRHTARVAAIAVAATLLGACASVPDDRGVSALDPLLSERLDSDPGWLEALSEGGGHDVLPAGYFSEPVTMARAEQASLVLNPAVRAALADVGLVEADYAQAARIRNPGFSYERYSSDINSSTLLFDVGGLLLLPLRREVERQRLKAVQYQAAAEVMNHIADLRRAWIEAVARQRQLALADQVVESARTGNRLIRQMTGLGHSSRLEAINTELALNDALSNLARQRLAAGAAREKLVRLIGLWGEPVRTFSLPEDLPPLPDEPLLFESVEQMAVQTRLDVAMARVSLETLASNYDLTRRNVFLSSIELGPTLERGEGERLSGYELELSLPLFDIGTVRGEKARIRLEQATASAEATAIAAASEARQALFTYQTLHEIAYNYERRVLPLRSEASAEQMLRYNGMLISVFDLLEDARQAYAVQSAAVDALKDFWIADTNLTFALVGTGGGEMAMTGNLAPASAPAGSGGH